MTISRLLSRLPDSWHRVWCGVAVGLVLLHAHGLRAQRNLDLSGFLPYAERLSDVWGYAAPDGTEYALVGAFNGLSIVSLADPTDPVEVQFIGGPESIWRDIKTWEERAYVVNETSGGLLIVDLSGLPGSVDTLTYRDRGLQTAHNIYIDSLGRAFLFGSNLDAAGTSILDLVPDPAAPSFLGAYEARYVHDGYARGNALWNGEIINGTFSLVDISDPSSPLVVADESSPNGLTHAAWLADSDTILAVVEESAGGLVLTYDVSDPTDIQELGRYRSNWSVPVIPHNIFYRGNWLVVSAYTDGVTLVDAARPSNLVETGRFDTSPVPSQEGFNGCWGVYPYLPSGLILATDIEEGLFVLTPEYQRAAYLEGTVRDISGTPRLYAQVEIPGSVSRPYVTDFTGFFATGTADTGTATVRVTASGCATAFYSVNLVAGELSILDPVLSCSTTALPGPSAEGLVKLSLEPALFAGQTRLRWDLGAVWEPGASVRSMDLSGRIHWQASLPGPSGSVETGADWSEGMHLLEVQSGPFRYPLRAIKTRAP